MFNGKKLGKATGLKVNFKNMGRIKLKKNKKVNTQEKKVAMSIEKLCQPIEISLQMEGGLKVVDQDEKRTVRPIKPLEQNGGDGLLSLMSKQSVSPKLVVVITVYNETRTQMNQTLDGILGSLTYFREAGISNHEICVVCIFDGIHKMNNEDDNDKNVILMYKEFDMLNNITNENLQMGYRFKVFCDVVEQSSANIDKIRKEMKAKSSIISLSPHQQTIYDKLKVKNPDAKDEDIKLEAMEQSKKDAQKYISDRNSTSWLYQCRRELQIEDDRPDDEQEEVIEDEQKEEDKPIKQIVYEELKRKYLYIWFCAKYKNGGKLSSHLWFFRGFCEVFQPRYCALVDCGLETSPIAMWKFFLSFETDPIQGGVCGFMGLRPERVYDDHGIREDGYDKSKVDCVTNLLIDIFCVQKAQVFEYDFAHFIDKPFESIFGFIHVLPGAFSAYRWDALKRDKNGSILDAYLKMQLDPLYQYKNLEEANMYLAEDRILCLKIYSKKGQRYTLRYLQEASAVVDPVTTLTSLMGQRRRWINGTWFALQYVIDNSYMVKDSSHSAFERFWFRVNMIYSMLNKLLTYYVIGIYFSVLFMMMNDNFLKVFKIPNFLGDASTGRILLALVCFTYIFLVGTLIFYALHYTQIHKLSNPKYWMVSTFLGLFMTSSFLFLLYGIMLSLFIDSDVEPPLGHPTYIDRIILKIAIICTLVFHGIPILFNLSYLPELLGSTFHYVYYAPTYIHVLIIYAFCRIDDLSWGTKGLEGGEDPKMMKIKDKNTRYKYIYVCKWLGANTLFAYCTIQLTLDSDIRRIMIMCLALFVTGLLCFRCIGALLHYGWYWLYLLPFMERRYKERIDKANVHPEAWFIDAKKLEETLQMALLKNFSKIGKQILDKMTSDNKSVKQILFTKLESGQNDIDNTKFLLGK